MSIHKQTEVIFTANGTTVARMIGEMNGNSALVLLSCPRTGRVVSFPDMPRPLADEVCEAAVNNYESIIESWAVNTTEQIFDVELESYAMKSTEEGSTLASREETETIDIMAKITFHGSGEILPIEEHEDIDPDSEELGAVIDAMEARYNLVCDHIDG